MKQSEAKQYLRDMLWGSTEMQKQYNGKWIRGYSIYY